MVPRGTYNTQVHGNKVEQGLEALGEGKAELSFQGYRVSVGKMRKL